MSTDSKNPRASARGAVNRLPSRPIGERIREVLQVVEKLGAATAPQIRQHLKEDVEDSNVMKYCSRAAGLQLLTVDRSQRPMVFRVAPGWQAIIGRRYQRPPGQAQGSEGIVPAAVRSQPNSVFALGTMA